MSQSKYICCTCRSPLANSSLCVVFSASLLRSPRTWLPLLLHEVLFYNEFLKWWRNPRYFWGYFKFTFGYCLLHIILYCTKYIFLSLFLLLIFKNNPLSSFTGCFFLENCETGDPLFCVFFKTLSYLFLIILHIMLHHNILTFYFGRCCIYFFLLYFTHHPLLLRSQTPHDFYFQIPHEFQQRWRTPRYFWRYWILDNVRYRIQ